MSIRVSRRRFMKTAAAAAAVAGLPRAVVAQAKTLKIGAIHPATGALAEIGQACRLAAQIAVDTVNAAGGIKSMGGAKLELLIGDSETKPEVARSEAERVINAGAVMITGAFHSGHTNAIVPVAQQRRVPFIVDVSTADEITANVAKSVREGRQKVQYVYRNFPTASMFAPRAVQFMTEIFKDAGGSPKRVVLMYVNDAFGKPQADTFLAAYKAMHPAFEIVEVISYPDTTTDLSTEVSRARVAKPDIIAPITRPGPAILLLQELAKQRVDVMGIISPGAPGLYESRQIEQLKELIEGVMDNVPWPNFKNPHTQRAAEEFRKRSGGKTLDTNSGYTYEAVLIIADVLERARSTDPDVIVGAIKKTRFTDQLMVAAGPVVFNETGDNPNASTTMIQILGQKPVVVWPKDVAAQKYVFPKPKR